MPCIGAEEQEIVSRQWTFQGNYCSVTEFIWCKVALHSTLEFGNQRAKLEEGNKGNV